MRDFEEWICSHTGQVLCVILFGVCLVAYVWVIILDNKWGDGE